jgi:hypothetical protein
MPDITAVKPVAGAPIESAWGGQVHDALEGIQTGSVTGLAALSGNSGSSHTLTFPRAYATPPVVMVMAESNGYNASAVATVTTTTCTVRLYNPTATNQASLAYRWVAIGTPA